MAVALPCLGQGRLTATEGATRGFAPVARSVVQDAPPPPDREQMPENSAITPPNDAAATKPDTDTGPAFKPISGINLDIRSAGNLFPHDSAAAYFQRAAGDANSGDRDWAIREFNWAAPDFCHRPLYFEEVYLERYGYPFGVAQPAVSSAQFVGRSVALPCLMVVRQPWECVYPLGHERPGDCVPFTSHGPATR